MYLLEKFTDTQINGALSTMFIEIGATGRWPEPALPVIDESPISNRLQVMFMSDDFMQDAMECEKLTRYLRSLGIPYQSTLRIVTMPTTDFIKLFIQRED